MIQIALILLIALTFSICATPIAKWAALRTGVVSIPNRYMHSPNEMLDLSDVEHAARLIAAFVRGIGSADEFIPE